MTAPLHRILIIGCGSIGERHLRTFQATGRAEVVACDPLATARDRMAKHYGVTTQEHWETALEDDRLTAAVVATPAPLHVPMATKILQRGRHVLIEKPLAVDLAGVDDLVATRDRSEKHVAVAYPHHCQPALQGARAWLHSGRFGPVRQAAIVAGQHFPTYRPAYRNIYYNDHAQGGGAIQDALTHLANAVEWILGPTQRVFCDAAHQVLEGVEVEDTVGILARTREALVSYALNQFQAPNEIRLDFHAAGGSVRVELHAQRWGTMSPGERDWTWHDAPVGERDRLFTMQASAFLDGCEGRPNPLCTLEEGIQALRFNLAALRSSRTGEAVDL